MRVTKYKQDKLFWELLKGSIMSRRVPRREKISSSLRRTYEIKEEDKEGIL